MSLISRRRISVLFAQALSLLAFSLGFAGHDLFNQLVVTEQFETGLDRQLAPVSIGIPVPDTSEITSTDGIVLAGSRDAQFAILDRWPSGTIRWLLVDALVDIPNLPGMISLQLTTGQPLPERAAIALQTSSGIDLNNQKIQFTAPESDNELIVNLRNAEAPSDTGYSLERSLVNTELSLAITAPSIVQNGPVRSTVLRTETLSQNGNRVHIEIRTTLFRDQTNFQIEFTASADVENTQAFDFPEMRLKLPFEVEDVPSPVPAGIDLPQRQFSSINKEPRIAIVAAGPLVSNAPIRSSEESSHQITALPKTVLAAGTLIRTTFSIDTAATAGSLRLLGSPLIGRDVSVETYNDAFAFQDKLIADNTEPGPLPTPEFPDTSDLIRAYLQGTGTTLADRYTAAKTSVEAHWQKPKNSSAPIGEAPAIWPMLTGDLALLSAYGRYYDSFVREVQADSTELRNAESVLQLINTSPQANPKEINDLIWTLLESWLIENGKPKPDLESAILANGAPLLKAIPELINRRGFDEERQDILWDLLEAVVTSTPPTRRHERWYCQAYLLTSNNDILRSAVEALDLTSAPFSNLKHLIHSKNRYRIWKPLTLQRNTDGDVLTAEWNTPFRAEIFRLKYANKPINVEITGTPSEGIPFFQASNLGNEPRPADSQSLLSVKLPIPANQSLHIAGRYLERGDALPAPDRPKVIESTPTLDSEKNGTKSLPSWLWLIGLILIILAVVLTSRSKSTIKILQALIGAICLFLASGCDTKEAAQQTPSTDLKKVRTVTTSEGNFRVSYSPQPDPIPLNEHFGALITIEPLTGVNPPQQVIVDANMPAHGHGINTIPTLKVIDAERFSVEGLLFHMKGDWELTVDVVDGPIKERASFPIKL